MTREELIQGRLLNLNAEAEIDFELTDFNLKEKSLASPNIKIKWTRILAEERKLLNIINDKLDEYKRDLIKNKFDINVAQFKKEIEIDKDNGIVKIKKAIDSQKDVIRFVEGVLKISLNFGFDLKNVIDVVKLENS